MIRCQVGSSSLLTRFLTSCPSWCPASWGPGRLWWCRRREAWRSWSTARTWRVSSLLSPGRWRSPSTFSPGSWYSLSTTWSLTKESPGNLPARILLGVINCDVRFDRYQAECVVPWVNDVLLLLTVSLQTAQQLRDKLEMFKQYKQEIRLTVPWTISQNSQCSI